MPKKIAVVGGAESLIKGNLGRNFLRHDVQIEWHYHYRSKTWDGKFAKKCEGVVLLLDMSSHAYYAKAVTEAKSRGLPFACVPRKWSQAENILRIHGILEPVTNGDVPLVTPPEDILKAGTSYLVRERVEGRLPGKAEVGAALSRAYGKGLVVSDQEFREMHSRACQESARQAGEVAPEEVVGIFDWMVLIVEEHPGILLTPDRAAKDAMRLADLKGKRNKTLALQAMVKIQAMWNSGNPKHTAWRDQLIMVWLKEAFRLGQKMNTLPRGTSLLRDGVTLFSSETAVSMRIKEARMAVLGNWADDLMPLSRATQDFKRKWDDREFEGLRPTLKSLIKNGLLAGIKQPTSQERWVTSDRAMEAYLDTLEPKETEVTPEHKPYEGDLEMPSPETPDIWVSLTAFQDELRVIREEAAVRDDLQAEVVALREEVAQLREQQECLNRQTRLGELEDRVLSLERPTPEASPGSPDDLLKTLMEMSAAAGVVIKISPATGRQGGS